MNIETIKSEMKNEMSHLIGMEFLTQDPRTVFPYGWSVTETEIESSPKFNQIGKTKLLLEQIKLFNQFRTLFKI